MSELEVIDDLITNLNALALDVLALHHYMDNSDFRFTNEGVDLENKCEELYNKYCPSSFGVVAGDNIEEIKEYVKITAKYRVSFQIACLEQEMINKQRRQQGGESND